jgi:hypothetical protein
MKRSLLLFLLLVSCDLPEPEPTPKPDISPFRDVPVWEAAAELRRVHRCEMLGYNWLAAKDYSKEACKRDMIKADCLEQELLEMCGWR